MPRVSANPAESIEEKEIRGSAKFLIMLIWTAYAYWGVGFISTGIVDLFICSLAVVHGVMTFVLALVGFNESRDKMVKYSFPLYPLLFTASFLDKYFHPEKLFSKPEAKEGHVKQTKGDSIPNQQEILTQFHEFKEGFLPWVCREDMSDVFRHAFICVQDEEEIPVHEKLEPLAEIMDSTDNNELGGWISEILDEMDGEFIKEVVSEKLKFLEGVAVKENEFKSAAIIRDLAKTVA